MILSHLEKQQRREKKFPKRKWLMVETEYKTFTNVF